MTSCGLVLNYILSYLCLFSSWWWMLQGTQRRRGGQNFTTPRGFLRLWADTLAQRFASRRTFSHEHKVFRPSPFNISLFYNVQIHLFCFCVSWYLKSIISKQCSLAMANHHSTVLIQVLVWWLVNNLSNVTAWSRPRFVFWFISYTHDTLLWQVENMLLAIFAYT